MALSTEQELALFEILEVPYATEVNRLNADEDHLMAYTRQVSESSRAAKILLQSWHQALPSAVEVQLKVYLDAWIALGVNVTVMDQGSLGSLAGVSDSPALEREEIRRRVLTIVPFTEEAFSKAVRPPERRMGGSIGVIR